MQFNVMKGNLRHYILIPPGGASILAHALAHVASWLRVGKYAICLGNFLRMTLLGSKLFLICLWYSLKKSNPLVMVLNLLLAELRVSLLRGGSLKQQMLSKKESKAARQKR